MRRPGAARARVSSEHIGPTYLLAGLISEHVSIYEAWHLGGPLPGRGPQGLKGGGAAPRCLVLVVTVLESARGGEDKVKLLDLSLSGSM